MDESIFEEKAHSSPLIINLLLQSLQKNPDKIGLEFNDISLTNGQLLSSIITLSHKLASIGISKNMRICVLLERSPEALLTLWALWHVGATYIPLDAEHPQERLEAMCDDAQPSFIITQATLNKKLQRLPQLSTVIELQKIDFTQENCFAINEKLNSCSYSTETLAYILYTSGTSGDAKGVEISHHSLSNLFQGILPLLELGPQHVFIGLANFSFDISFFEILAPFLVGGKLILLNAEQYKDPKIISATIEAKSINVLQATPSLWSLINHYSWNKKQRNILSISTGEALPNAIANDILQHTHTLWNLYGPTECTIWASAKKLNLSNISTENNDCISIGQALPGYSFSLKAQYPNELCISGAGLARGYYNKAQLSAKKFILIDGQKAFYRTGDIVHMDSNGDWHFHGRLDNQVKHNGYRIELEEIEAALETHPSIKQALTGVQAASHHDKSFLFAYIAHEIGMPNKTKESLNTFLLKSLPQYMLPQRYFFVESIPLTTNGKKDRKTLPNNLFNNIASSIQNSALPKTAIEKIIAGFFCDILEIKEIGRFDSFFDAGGNSMLAASLTMAINNHFKTTIALKSILLTPPTVHSTSLLVQQ